MRKGNATSDNVCETEAFISTTQPRVLINKGVVTTATTMAGTLSANPESKTESILSPSTFVSGVANNYSTKSPPPSTVSDVKLGTVTDLMFSSSHYEKTVQSNQCLNISLFLTLSCVVVLC